MFKDFSDRALKAVKAAEELAARLGDKAVASAHLIYGLAADQAGIPHHILKDINVDPAMFSGYLEKLPREEAPADGGTFHPDLLKVFDRARELSRSMSAEKVSPEHLLVALLSLKQGSCHVILEEFSVDADDLRIECLEALGYEDEECPRWT